MHSRAAFTVSSDLDEDPLHLIHRHFIIPPIIQRRRTRRFVCRHLLRELTTTAVAQVLSWAEDESTGDVQFQVPKDVEWVRLALRYERPQGEMRMEGDVVLESVELTPL